MAPGAAIAPLKKAYQALKISASARRFPYVRG